MNFSRDDIRSFILAQNPRANVSDSSLPTQDWIDRHARSILLHVCRIGRDLDETIRLRFGAEADILYLNDPWRIHAEVSGVDYATAHRLWLRSDSLANPASLIRASIFEAFREANENGDVFIDRTQFFHAVSSLTAANAEQIRIAYDKALDRYEITEFCVDGVARVALKRHIDEERRIARIFTSRIGPCPTSDTAEEIAAALINAGCHTPDADQAAAVKLIRSNRTSLLTGGPGSGKTTILKAVATLALQKNPDLRIICVSLAARVARTFHSKTGLAADTIHKFLEYENGEFRRGSGWPVEADLILVEEAFMTDNYLIAALGDALPPASQIVFIGDPQQLEPIGRGRPVHCFAESTFMPHAHLKSNHRSRGHEAIPASGQRVMRGLSPIVGNDLMIYKAMTDTQTIEFAVLAYRLAAEKLGGAQHVQVLTARNQGSAGATAINNAITGREDFDVGDRVIQTRNDRDADIFNGELGVIRELGQKGLIVETDQGAIVEYRSRKPATLSKAYCITFHKAQGAEYPAVINVIHPSARRMMSRAMLNVAITRARVFCALIDQRNEMARTLSTRPGRANVSLLPLILKGNDPTA